MNIEEIRKQIEQSQNEIVHLNDEIRNLNQARNDMTEETYNRELEKINRYIENAQKSLEENQRLNRAYDNMLRNIKRLNILDDYAREETDQKNLEEIAEERERLEEEIKSSRKVLPEELQEEIRNTILTGTNTNQIPNSANNQQKNNLDKLTLEFRVKTGEGDKVFGSVSLKQVKDALSKKGYKLEKSQIELTSSMSSLGFHYININLYPGVKATIKAHIIK